MMTQKGQKTKFHLTCKHFHGIYCRLADKTLYYTLNFLSPCGREKKTFSFLRIYSSVAFIVKSFRILNINKQKLILNLYWYYSQLTETGLLVLRKSLSKFNQAVPTQKNFQISFSLRMSIRCIVLHYFLLLIGLLFPLERFLRKVYKYMYIYINKESS